MGTVKSQNRGLNLPRSLLDDIERRAALTSAENGHRRNVNKTTPVSRKDARKQERIKRKKRNADYFSAVGSLKRRRGEEDVGSLQSKRARAVHSAEDARVGPSLPRDKAVPAIPDPLESLQSRQKSKPKPRVIESSLPKSTTKPQKRKKVLRTPNAGEEDEEAHITYYEAMLGYSDGKRKQSDGLDGLDDLLDFTDSLIPHNSKVVNEAEEDLQSTLGSTFDQPSESESAEALQSASEGHSEEEKWTGFGTDVRVVDEHGGNDDQLPSNGPVLSSKEPTSPARRYIPPGTRQQTEGNASVSEDLTKLTRQLKGLLNRMTEQNMATVLSSTEEVYRKYRRHDVTSTLSTLIIDGISSHAVVLDSFVVLHAALISSMHRLIGIDFVAFTLQNIVASYESHLADAENATSGDLAAVEDRGKECSNLVVLLSELYNFQVIACVLMYDLIRDLLTTDLSELRIELLLKILRSCGQQLRQDDPSALKDIVSLAQSCITEQGNSLSSRARFMMETLTNLKNNKLKKSAAAQHQGGDAVERLKKFLVGLGKSRHVHAHEPLRVSLEDLRTAESKGKWWLVGAAWAGDPLVDRQQGASKATGGSGGNAASNSLLELAQKQGMNTDIRRSIFAVLMSSEDYLDACERLSQLNLTEVQQREIAKISLHCCGNEKSYNPYYTLVCKHLCQSSHSHKITLQYWLWDFLRELGETTVGGAEVVKNLRDDEGRFEVENISSSRLKNVAKAYGWWIAKDTCSLLILKPVDFTVLKPQSRRFLKELFVQVFVASQVSSPMLTDHIDEQNARNRGVIEDIFIKPTKAQNLGLGLIFFLSQAFRDDQGFLKWASLVAKEALQTGMDHIPKV